MKKIKFLTILLCAFFLVSCASEKQESKTIIIGTMPSVDSLPLAIAEKEGFFEKHGVDVKLEVFNSPVQRDAALQANEIDGVIADSIALGLYQNADLDMRVLSLSSGNFNLIVNDKNIKEVKDLKGKQVIISENTVIDFLNYQILKEANLSEDDIEKVVIAPLPARLEALNNKQADAVILPAPYDTFALDNNHHIIKTIVNEQQQISLLLLNNTILEANSTDVENFVKAYNEAVDYLNSVNANDIKDLIIETVGYDQDSKQEIKLPNFIKITLPDANKVDEALQWSKERGLINKDLKAKDLMVEINVKD